MGFHMLEKQIPVDSVEVKESVHAFSWEPVGSKFAIIHGDTQFLNVSFYGIKLGQTPIMLKKYDRKTANHIFWSPNGQFVVLAGLRSMNGLLEFIDTSDFTTMGTDDHFMCTDVEWDPTGRYVITPCPSTAVWSSGTESIPTTSTSPSSTRRLSSSWSRRMSSSSTKLLLLTSST